MAEQAVNLSGVRKDFGDFTAVRDLDLEIRDGEFFSLLGPSGCGKTTTLRMIAGFEFPTEGSVRIHGEEMGLRPPNKRPVNTVFQSYALFPHMTVFDNVAFGLRMSKVESSQVVERTRRVLDMVQLAKRALQLAPNNPALWTVLGQSQLNAGDCGGAIESLEKAGSIEPPASRLDLAMAYWKVGDHQRGRQLFDEFNANEGHKQTSIERRLFRAEVEHALGINKEKPDKGDRKDKGSMDGEEFLEEEVTCPPSDASLP